MSRVDELLSELMRVAHVESAAEERTPETVAEAVVAIRDTISGMERRFGEIVERVDPAKARSQMAKAERDTLARQLEELADETNRLARFYASVGVRAREGKLTDPTRTRDVGVYLVTQLAERVLIRVVDSIRQDAAVLRKM